MRPVDQRRFPFTPTNLSCCIPLGFNSSLILGLVQELVVVFYSTKARSDVSSWTFSRLSIGLYHYITNECFGVTRL